MPPGQAGYLQLLHSLPGQAALLLVGCRSLQQEVQEAGHLASLPHHLQARQLSTVSPGGKDALVSKASLIRLPLLLPRIRLPLLLPSHCLAVLMHASLEAASGNS